MKKTYQQPATRVVTIQQKHQLLAGSLRTFDMQSSKQSYARDFNDDWDDNEDEE